MPGRRRTDWRMSAILSVERTSSPSPCPRPPGRGSDELELLILLDLDLTPISLAFVLLLARVLAVCAGGIRGGHFRKLLLARVLGPTDKQKRFVSRGVSNPLLRELYI